MLSNSKVIVGVDEAGRGSLAGPVAVGVVAVDEGFNLLAAFPGLNDSKQLSEKRREVLFEILEEHVNRGDVRFHVSLLSAEHIDKNGITHAVRTGVYKGIRELMPDPSHGRVVLDGLLHAPEEYQQETIIGGDAIEPTIMLASVAAKVTRDRLMKKLAEQFPHYGFEKHKGYGTQAHYAALNQHGLCELHRRSYLKQFSQSTA